MKIEGTGGNELLPVPQKNVKRINSVLKKKSYGKKCFSIFNFCIACFIG